MGFIGFSCPHPYATLYLHWVAEIHVNRILKLDRAEKQDEPAHEVDPSKLPADEPTA
jgi:hypothetical protein